jgi:hypothetical protein
MSDAPSEQDEIEAPEQGVFTFTALQAAYMREKKENYEAANKKECKAIARKVAEHLAAEVERQSGNSMASQSKKKLLAVSGSEFLPSSSSPR